MTDFPSKHWTIDKLRQVNGNKLDAFLNTFQTWDRGGMVKNGKLNQ